VWWGSFAPDRAAHGSVDCQCCMCVVSVLLRVVCVHMCLLFRYVVWCGDYLVCICIFVFILIGYCDVCCDVVCYGFDGCCVCVVVIVEMRHICTLYVMRCLGIYV